MAVGSKIVSEFRRQFTSVDSSIVKNHVREYESDAKIRPDHRLRRFRMHLKTQLFCMWFCPCRGQYPVPGSSLDGTNPSELIMKNYELNLLAFYARIVSLNFNLLAVSLYRLIYLSRHSQSNFRKSNSIEFNRTQSMD